MDFAYNPLSTLQYQTKMGKKNTQTQEAKLPTNDKPQQLEVQQQNVSKQLTKFLPYSKFVVKKTKLITKRKDQAIKHIIIDKFQVASAIQCLQKFDSQNRNVTDLFTDDGFIYLQIDMSRVPTHYSIKPVQISLPHPIYSADSRFTIFVSDPERDYTEKIQDFNIPQIAEVIGYQRAKKTIRQNKDKSKLLAGNDLFFCDWKIYNLLRQPLGKMFYQKKKFPFPIDCEDVPQNLKTKITSYEQYLNDLGKHTYFMMGNGPVYTVKIGKVSMDKANLVQNIMRGVYRVVPHILGDELKVQDVRQICLKTYNSPSLPIYNFFKEQEVKHLNKSKTQQNARKKSK